MATTTAQTTVTTAHAWDHTDRHGRVSTRTYVLGHIDPACSRITDGAITVDERDPWPCPDCVMVTIPRDTAPNGDRRDSIDPPDPRPAGPATGSGPSIAASDKQVRFLTALVRGAMPADDLAALGAAEAERVIGVVVTELAKDRRRTSTAIDRYKADGVRPVWDQLTDAPEAAQDRPSRPATPTSGLDLTNLPAGRYAVPGGSRLKIQVDRPTEGRWAGFVFVKDAAEYGMGERYGKQAPGALYSGRLVDELTTILADPQAAMAAYGHLVGRCGACNRTLEDEQSVALGIGPVCRGKLGWA